MRSVEPTLKISPLIERSSINSFNARDVSCDVAERPGLHPVPVDLERRAGQRVLHEARDDHPVLAALARADGVEQPHDHAVEPALLVVREREELVDRLRVRVPPALFGRRPVDAASVLLERLLLAMIAVDLRRRRDEHTPAEAVAVLEHGLGPLDVRDECAHGLLDDQPDAHRCREVEHDVAPVHELADDGLVQHRVDDEVIVAPIAKVGDVALRAGRQVVERIDLPAVREQEFGEVGADEAGPAGHECGSGRLHGVKA